MVIGAHRLLFVQSNLLGALVVVELGAFIGGHILVYVFDMIVADRAHCGHALSEAVPTTLTISHIGLVERVSSAWVRLLCGHVSVIESLVEGASACGSFILLAHVHLGGTLTWLHHCQDLGKALAILKSRKSESSRHF